MGACYSFLSKSKKQPEQKPRLAQQPPPGQDPGQDPQAAKTWYLDRADLATVDLMINRVWHNSLLRVGEQCMAHQMHMAFFREGGFPGRKKAFSYTPIWRLAENRQMLDYIVLGVDATDPGQRFVQFNGKERHGTWAWVQPFLDVKLNVRFGEAKFPAENPESGKWLRFQNLPGTMTWIRCEEGADPMWVVIMAEIPLPELPRSPSQF